MSTPSTPLPKRSVSDGANSTSPKRPCGPRRASSSSPSAPEQHFTIHSDVLGDHPGFQGEVCVLTSLKAKVVVRPSVSAGEATSVVQMLHMSEQDRAKKDLADDALAALAHVEGWSRPESDRLRERIQASAVDVLGRLGGELDMFGSRESEGYMEVATTLAEMDRLRRAMEEDLGAEDVVQHFERALTDLRKVMKSELFKAEDVSAAAHLEALVGRYVEHKLHFETVRSALHVLAPADAVKIVSQPSQAYFEGKEAKYRALFDEDREKFDAKEAKKRGHARFWNDTYDLWNHVGTAGDNYRRPPVLVEIDHVRRVGAAVYKYNRKVTLMMRAVHA